MRCFDVLLSCLDRKYWTDVHEVHSASLSRKTLLLYDLTFKSPFSINVNPHWPTSGVIQTKRFLKKLNLKLFLSKLRQSSAGSRSQSGWNGIISWAESNRLISLRSTFYLPLRWTRVKTAVQIVTHLRQFQWSDNKGSSSPKRGLRMCCRDLHNDARRGTRSLNPLGSQMRTETIQMSCCAKTTWDKHQLTVTVGGQGDLITWSWKRNTVFWTNAPWHSPFILKRNNWPLLAHPAGQSLLWHQGEPALIVIDLRSLRQYADKSWQHLKVTAQKNAFIQGPLLPEALQEYFRLGAFLDVQWGSAKNLFKPVLVVTASEGDITWPWRSLACPSLSSILILAAWLMNWCKSSVHGWNDP